VAQVIASRFGLPTGAAGAIGAVITPLLIDFLSSKIQGGGLIVVDALSAPEVKTKAAVGMLKAIGVNGKALLVDVKADEKLALSVRNLPGVALLPSNRITARDVADTKTVVVTQAALEKLEAALG
jgi:large subunit ribosomal protein L4